MRELSGLARLPIVLLGGTNLVRAAGLAGIPVIVASCDPDEPAFASRYCVARCMLPPLSRPESVIEALLDLSTELFDTLGKRVPLMFGNDDWLELVYAHRERLQAHYLLLLNDPEVAQSLGEKSRFAQLAAERHLPVPLQLRWEGTGPDALRTWSDKVLVKPKQKLDWHDSPLHDLLFTDGGKALVFDDGAATMANPLVERHRNQLLFQEFIPGDDRQLWSFHGFADEDGKVVQSFVGRKLRTSPPVTGESAYIEMVCDPGLATFGRLMAERIPLRGFFKIDFKQDPRDGRLLVLEVNARCTLWHYVGAVNGVNLMKAAYAYLVEGKRAAPSPYSTRIRWLYLRLDFQAYRALAKAGELDIVRWLASLVRHPKVYNVFAWNDPGPFLALWIGRFTRRARRIPEKLASFVRQWRSTAS